MSDLDDFLTPALARQLDAEQAPINGDPGPRLEMWSTQDPVTAPYKYPREIEFTDELPKTISGKIRRVELRERKQATAAD
jgi:acyl-coenzyme A synthetase/AMP-(fatty) acid ligase